MDYLQLLYFLPLFIIAIVFLVMNVKEYYKTSRELEELRNSQLEKYNVSTERKRIDLTKFK